MRISEIFYSVQGEGSLVGVPSVFVRTSGCNLRCGWCDTPYTSWSPEGSETALDRVIEQVEQYGVRHIVFTGGEPMIAPEAVAFTQRLRSLGAHITIETAGTVYRPVECDLMSISPKLKNSVPYEREGGRWAAQHERLRYNHQVLRQLTDQYPFQLKFVVTSTDDLAELETMRRDLGIAAEHVMLMPEGTEAAALHARAHWIVETCKQRGYRYSPRLHVDLWGAKRGV